MTKNFFSSWSKIPQEHLANISNFKNSYEGWNFESIMQLYGLNSENLISFFYTRNQTACQARHCATEPHSQPLKT